MDCIRADSVRSRRMMVLRAVVEDYIRTHEPVGSATIAKHYHLGVSSATIRNDMSALEEEGYLVQPHTSAGRIPTERGYRYFVNGVAEFLPLSAAQRRATRNFLHGSVSLQDTLQRSARLLAKITGQVALVASPALSRCRVRHIELVQVSTTSVLMVVITDTGGVAQHLLPVSQMQPDRLQDAISLVNEVSVGLSMLAAAQQIRAIKVHPEDIVMRKLINEIVNALISLHEDEPAKHELYMAGASQLAHQHNVNDIADLFDALEEQAVLIRLMTSLSQEASENANGVSVAIGSETHTPGLLNASVVTTGYGYEHADLMRDDELEHVEDQVSRKNHTVQKSETGEILVTQQDEQDYRYYATVESKDVKGDNTVNEPVAFIGSIGPQHMDYVATMAAVRAVARYLSDFLAQNR